MIKRTGVKTVPEKRSIMGKNDNENKVLAANKKVFHDYHVLERFEAGIQLTGTEVKSCRAGAVAMNEAYVRINNGQAWLINMHIAAYDFGNRFNHEAMQQRRLLLHRNEILKLAQWLGTKGGTLVPVKMYLKGSLIKMEIAYCQGKNRSDKRDDLRKKQSELEMRRIAGKF